MAPPPAGIFPAGGGFLDFLLPQELHGVHAFPVLADGKVQVVADGAFQQGTLPHGADGLAQLHFIACGHCRVLRQAGVGGGIAAGMADDWRRLRASASLAAES